MRLSTLTGNPVPEPGKTSPEDRPKLPALGGEIGKTRGELNALRTRGAQSIAIKIGAILLAALLLPRLIMLLLRRALGRDESGNSSMVLTAIGAFLKVTI